MKDCIFRAGIFSDVQALAALHNAEIYNLKHALDLFREQECDLLINAGDFAEGADPATFDIYWKLIEERFGKEPAHIACEGNHECSRLPKGAVLQETEIWQKICKGFRRGTENPFVMEYKGFPFVSFAAAYGWHYREEDLVQLDKVLHDLAEKYPGKPVFLITHFAPASTMIGSYHADASQGLRKVCGRYPQVVSFSGHMHIPVNDERDIWQGEFTAIATGTLAYGCFSPGNMPEIFNVCNGILPYGRESIQAMVMDVYGDHIEIRRYNVLEKKEISPEYRWKISIPYDPAKAVYTDARKALRTAPEFAGDAELLTRYDFGYFYLMFPHPEKGDYAQFYDVEISERLPDGRFAESVVTRFIGDFYRLEVNRKDLIELRLPGKGMKHSTYYRIRLYGVECFGKRGRPLEILEYTWPGYPFKDGAPLYPQE